MKAKNYLELAKKEVEEKLKDSTVLYVGLYGSQNYALDTPNSDYDFIAIILPTLERLLWEKPNTKTLDYEFGKIVVKDFRAMLGQWKKGSVNFNEILFTETYYINESYLPYMKWFRENAEQVAHINERATVLAMIGMMKERLKNLDNFTISQKEDVKQYGYSPKALANIYRLHSMIVNYKFTPYAELLNPFINKQEKLTDLQATRTDAIAIKNHVREYDKDKAFEIANKKLEEANNYFDQHKDLFESCNFEFYNKMKEKATEIYAFHYGIK